MEFWKCKMENMVSLNELNKVYKGKKVFLTGHTGFKGAWMLQTLKILGANVLGYSLAPKTNDDLYNLIDGNSLCNSVIADIRDLDKIKKEIKNYQPDYIFHFAAQPLVRLSYEIPIETYETNVLGTANLLESLKMVRNKCTVIIITTDKVYKNLEWEYPYRETDNLGGYDPYSASKACAELLIDSYRNSFFNLNNYENHKKGIAVARAGNVIGGGDWSKDRLIPDVVRSLENKKKINIRNPNSIRPWQHVLEPIIGYLSLGINLSSNPIRFSNAYNFGPNTSDFLSVKDIVELSIDFWGNGAYSIKEELNQPHEAKLLKLDISKAFSELNWHPIFCSKQSLEFTLEWYRNFNARPELVKFYTKNQIESYLKLLKNA